jgi:ABC transporter
MIEARDLTKIYGGKAAVDHLSFTVEPGQVTGFLGPNGAGKSTTMRLIPFAAWRPRPSGRGETPPPSRVSRLYVRVVENWLVVRMAYKCRAYPDAEQVSAGGRRLPARAPRRLKLHFLRALFMPRRALP